jgi:hypothetical protein
VACVLKQAGPQEWGVSLRSKGGVDVCRIAVALGGGGLGVGVAAVGDGAAVVAIVGKGVDVAVAGGEACTVMHSTYAWGSDADLPVFAGPTRTAISAAASAAGVHHMTDGRSSPSLPLAFPATVWPSRSSTTTGTASACGTMLIVEHVPGVDIQR